MSLYILMTWVYDRFTAVPYLRFLGEPGTGKTRTLEVASSICYKAVKVSGNITGAALFRTIDLIKGTTAVDESDFKNSGEWSDIIKVLNNGYSAGTPVIRCNAETFAPEAFHVYGPKIISTRKRFDDDATETRCITFETKTQKLSPHIPLQLPITFEQETCMLRDKLLQWRFDHFHRIQAREQEVKNLSLSPRLGQIGASLAAVVPNPEWLDKLVNFLQRLEDDRKNEGPKGLIKRAIQELSEDEAVYGRVTVRVVAERVNKLIQDSGFDAEEMTPRKVGGILRSMGIRPKEENTGNTINPDEAWEVLCGR